MNLNYSSALKMMITAKETNSKLSVAHYRRAHPYFLKIKKLLDDNVIGPVRIVRLEFYKKLLSVQELELPGNAWRVNMAIAGGGLFHDLAPHQLDLMHYFFGAIENAAGVAVNQSHLYEADDVVAGNISFKNGVVFNGIWRFNVGKDDEKDYCEIVGSEGSISFSIFGEQKITVVKNDVTEIIPFIPPQHVQQPLIEKVVEYFLDEGPNPSSAEDGVAVMRLLDQFTINKY